MATEKANANCCWLFQIYKNKTEWLKLHLWHPLKPRWLAYIILTTFLGIIAWGLELYFGTTDLNFTFTVLASIVIALIVFWFTQKEIKRLEYADALKKLLIEFGYNKIYFDKFESNVEMRFDEFEEKKKWNWIPKQDSYTNWASGNNFQHKYFATNAYFNFINQGHILSIRYLPIPKGQIANVYESYFEFNVKLQHTENLINNFSSDYYITKIPYDTKDFYYRLLTDNTRLKQKIYKLNGTKNETLSKHSMIQNFCPFDTRIDIKKFLICEFRNYYANKHVNGGIQKNYEAVKKQLSNYYDYELEIWKLETKKENKK